MTASNDNEINDMLRDSEEKHLCRDAFDASTKGVLIEEGPGGIWHTHAYGMDTGDLSYAIAILQHRLFKLFKEEDSND